MSIERPASRGRVWAYTGAILGGVISIAANVAHSFVAPPGAAQNWAPQPGAVVGSMFWPILLFVAVEILARVKWPKSFWWGLLRFGGLLPVATVAGLVSYRHLRALLLFYGEDQTVAFLGPLAVDGLMVMATAAILVISMNDDTVNAYIAAYEVKANAPTMPVTNNATHRPASTQRDLLPVTTGIEVPEHLVSTARFAVSNHENRYGQTMTADQLSQVMNVNPDIAPEILATITPTPVLNGHASGGAS